MKKQLILFTILLSSQMAYSLCNTATTYEALQDCYSKASPSDIWQAAITSGKSYERIGKYCKIGDNSTFNRYACDYYVQGKDMYDDGYKGLPDSIRSTGCMKNGTLPGVHGNQTCFTSAQFDNLPSLKLVLNRFTESGIITDASACTSDGKLNAFKMIMDGVFDPKDPCGLKELADERETFVDAGSTTGGTGFNISDSTSFFYEITDGKYNQKVCYYKYEMEKTVKGIDVGVNIIRAPSALCVSRVHYLKKRDGGIATIADVLGLDYNQFLKDLAEAKSTEQTTISVADLRKAFTLTKDDYTRARKDSMAQDDQIESDSEQFNNSEVVSTYITNVKFVGVDLILALTNILATEDTNEVELEKATNSLYELHHGDLTIINAFKDNIESEVARNRFDTILTAKKDQFATAYSGLRASKAAFITAQKQRNAARSVSSSNSSSSSN